MGCPTGICGGVWSCYCSLPGCVRSLTSAVSSWAVVMSLRCWISGSVTLLSLLSMLSWLIHGGSDIVVAVFFKMSAMVVVGSLRAGMIVNLALSGSITWDGR